MFMLYGFIAVSLIGFVFYLAEFYEPMLNWILMAGLALTLMAILGKAIETTFF